MTYWSEQDREQKSYSHLDRSEDSGLTITIKEPNMSDKKQYSNFRKQAIIEDWPIGGGNRGSAIFKIESNNRGERCTRETEKKNGTWGKPKFSTYARTTRIADGDDGKTYIVQVSPTYRQIGIMQGNMKFSEETIFADDERYEVILRELEQSS